MAGYDCLRDDAVACSHWEESTYILYREGDLFTIKAYLIRYDPSRCGRPGSIPCRQIEYCAMPRADHRRPLQLSF